MALLPLTATFDDDFVALLVAVDDQDTVDVVGSKIAHHVIERRIRDRKAPIRVRHDGRVLDGNRGIGESGVRPLDHVEAFFDE
jgi:toluene monooxygenase system protein B